ncbi:acyl carrier protein [Paenibacillus sp. UMB4589-SE434]|uniref:acyl carrier protein n=1 Tax=Paenibacillus sp. UMB4589-SE434 TaxID=3046314 RepID=UPI002550E39C|nr:acyl carrier protein [Paenibacillus sp. UMB4589-SE434]
MILENLDKIKAEVVELINELLGESRVIGFDEDLIMFGLDSLKSIQFIVKLEDHFKIKFEIDELVLDHFSTVSKISMQVERKLN